MTGDGFGRPLSRGIFPFAVLRELATGLIRGIHLRKLALSLRPRRPGSRNPRGNSGRRSDGG